MQSVDFSNHSHVQQTALKAALKAAAPAALTRPFSCVDAPVHAPLDAVVDACTAAHAFCGRLVQKSICGEVSPLSADAAPNTTPVPAAAALPRRRWLQSALVCAALPWWPTAASAGAQREEPLADAVRSALHAAVSDLAAPLPVFVSDEESGRYWQWLRAASQRLQRRIPDTAARRDLLQTVWYEARRAALEVSLVLGVMEVESGFRKFAISSAGARGLMQIMPFWARLIGDGDESKLFHLQTNIRFGCVILGHYLEVERGNMFMALGRYNGSRGKSVYPNAVFAAQRKWKMHGF